MREVHGFGNPGRARDQEMLLAVLPSVSSSPVGGHPEGGHDAAESFAQLQGGVGGHLGGVVEAFDLRRAVQ